jgi:hypothetical protein
LAGGVRQALLRLFFFFFFPFLEQIRRSYCKRGSKIQPPRPKPMAITYLPKGGTRLSLLSLLLAASAGPKTYFAEPNRHVLIFLSSKFIVQNRSHTEHQPSPGDGFKLRIKNFHKWRSPTGSFSQIWLESEYESNYLKKNIVQYFWLLTRSMFKNYGY